MTDTSTGDMTPDEFRRWGHQVIDRIAEYFEHPESYPVLPDVAPGEIRSRIPPHPPRFGEGMETILADLDRVILPGLTHWNHPGFFAYFSSSASGPGILGELLAAAFNVNAMLWRTSPSATELEEAVLDWLRQMLGLPEGFRGVVFDGASVSTFHALAAARGSIEDWDVREDGIAGPDAPRLRLYTSEQAHSSVDKAAIALGLGRKGVRRIGVDAGFRMDARELEAKIALDRESGWRPFCVVATVGTTSTTSVDPVEDLAGICERQGLWLHVDAAYAGAAAILPERRDVLAGCDRADSLVMNPHKWLFTPTDFSAFFCRRPEALRRVFRLVPEYLTTSEGDSVTNFMDYGIQLGRRFRALKLWMVIRYFGVEGLRVRIREHIRLAGRFRTWLDESPMFDVLAPTPFSTVCFRLEGSDRENLELMDRINASGKIFISHTRLDERVALRFTIGSLRTDEAYVRSAWELIERAGREIREGR